MRNTFSRFDNQPPVNYGITVSEAKEYLRVDHGNDDITINLLITGSLEAAEAELGFPVMARSMSVELPVSWTMEIAPFYVKSVTSVTAGSSSYTDYKVVTTNEASYLMFNVLPDESFVDVEFTTGETVCPANVKLAMLKYIVDNYEQRTSDVYGVSLAKSSFSFERLLHPNKRYSV